MGTRRSIRLPNHDYTSPGAYFITICAFHKGILFEVDEVEAIPTMTWSEMPAHFTRTTADAFVVMPNHVHGIIFIDTSPVGAQYAAPWPNPTRPRAQHIAPLHGRNVPRGSLGAIVRSYKAAVTKTPRDRGLWSEAPLWQRHYYERVIRDEAELNRVREYILNNPLRWQFDRENPERIADAAYERDWDWLEGDAGA